MNRNGETSRGALVVVVWGHEKALWLTVLPRSSIVADVAIRRDEPPARTPAGARTIVQLVPMHEDCHDQSSEEAGEMAYVVDARHALGPFGRLPLWQ
eukprot:CAMPEP_0194750678 /NCGR_PEP_ID=MMETSP0323_2-20130528/4783_1 /TAXON_ID=2866 ORGANISM="Crypthecodinium cohnii, Strain Seligo" /NCGR_SAMPLE_ID=MMETSP0323_2 /ASSEMBLY_ACC=CAM_ASM_000346 /LENGTH=96 /DNA_ID=CAMNT_0039666653 /DNA_START=123 /DNA_END=412 /DNA_ORIENTATION=+